MNRGLRAGLPRSQWSAPSEDFKPLPPLVQGGKWQLAGNASWSTPTTLQLTPSSASVSGNGWLTEVVPLDGLAFVCMVKMAGDGVWIQLGDPALGDTPSYAGFSATHGPFVQYEPFATSTYSYAEPGGSGTGPQINLSNRVASSYDYMASPKWGGESGTNIAGVTGPMYFRARKFEVDGFYEIESGWGPMGIIKGVLPAPDKVLLGLIGITGGAYGLQTVTGFTGVCKA